MKPSNILVNKHGEIKLCDFGIAGELVNSYVGTNIGCKPYLAPERINPSRMDDPYDERSDVWSYGITIVSTFHLYTSLQWGITSNVGILKGRSMFLSEILIRGGRCHSCYSFWTSIPTSFHN